MVFIESEFGTEGHNRWDISRCYKTVPSKPLAEITLSAGLWTVTPLKQLSKVESGYVKRYVEDLRLGEPAKRSAEAFACRAVASLDRYANRLEDLEGFTEMVEALDAASSLLMAAEDVLQNQRALELPDAVVWADAA